MTLAEINETTTGGNGITGHNETSEDLAAAFAETDPTPGQAAQKNTVTVTFIANTATVPDTLGQNSTVQVRGAGGPLTWGGDSPVFLQNIGGDYWQGTAEFDVGEEVQFKFYTNVHDTVFSGAEWEHQGWEGDLDTGNRQLVVGAADTTLPLQFVNGWLAGAGQYETPYVTNDTSFVVWVRVNMQGWDDFSPDNHTVGIRGSNTVDWGQTGEISWGKTYPLTQESDHVNAGSQQYSGKYFYSGAIHVPNQYAGAGIKFKVVVHNAGAPLDEDWGNMAYNPSREDEIAISGIDTTLHWFWFDNLSPTVVEHSDEVVVTWVADMANAITNFGFAHGDTLLVRSGYYGTASEVRTKMMTRMGFTSKYTVTDTLMTTIGGHLDYQYYKVKNGVEYREIFYNFHYTGETTGEAERRVQEPVDGNAITIEDIVDSESNLHRMPLFRNTAVVARDVTVTFTCDVRPAIYQVMAGDTLYDIQGDVNITNPDEILALGVAINGPATGSWGNPVGPDWGPHLMDLENKRMYDDGSHGDAVAGDSIFTIVFQYFADSMDVVGQEFKFGIGGGDNEGGYGNNHIENIDDTQPASTIASSAWDFDNKVPTGIDFLVNKIPTEFALEQNYPNPFNPVTTIEYSVAHLENVTIDVYNLLGGHVATLVDEDQAPGYYKIVWDGKDSKGRKVGSGVYLYRIQAGSFTKTCKMLLMK